MSYPLSRLRRGQPEAEPMTEVNIIPVIDISLVLLVILFVTAPLLSYPNYPVDLPRSSAKGTGETTVAVTYAKDGRLAVAARDSFWETLEDGVKAELARDPDAVLILRVDKTAPYRVVERLLLACKRAGARRISLATEPYR